MKQIFALTSAMLAVEFTNQYSGENLIETLSFVEQKTGVTFDKIEEAYKVTGHWLNVLEAYDILLNVLLTKDVENIHEDPDLNLPIPIETNKSSGIWQRRSSDLPAHQFDTNETKQLINVVKTEPVEDEHYDNDTNLRHNIYQSPSHFTAVQNNKERISRRKSMPCKLFLETNVDDTYGNFQQECLTVKKSLKRKSHPIKFTVKNKRGRKKKMKDENEVFKCQMCDYAAKTTYQLSRHKLRKHNDGTRFQCSQCSKSYGVASDLTRHEKTVHETPMFVCEVCNKSYKSSRGYEDHLKSHNDDYVKPLFPCTSCEKMYSSKMGLAHHVKSEHLGIKPKHPFLCSICGQEFTNKVSLEGHSNVHAGLRPHLCKICGKSFATRNGIWHHSRTHDKTNRYTCETCGKTFKQVNSLKIHRKIHLEIRNFFCSICGKAFTQKQALSRHERVHSGVKPFECLLCNKRFYDTSIIRRHMIFMHKKAPERWKDDMFTHVNLLKKTDTDVNQI